IGVLKWKLAQGGSGADEERIRTTWESLTRPLLGAVRDVMRRQDAVMMVSADWQTPAGEIADRLRDLMGFTTSLDSELWRILKHISEELGVLPRYPNAISMPGDSASLLQYATPRSPDNFALREVARWKLNDLDESLTPPRGLTSSPEGSLFVSLWKSGTILRLDKKGTLLDRLDPPDSAPGQLQMSEGIAMDGLSRLWVIDGSQNSILIWDFRNVRSQVVKGEGSAAGGFRGPLWICAGPEGFMLISDNGNHRIVRISLEGACDVFAGGPGSGPGQFKHPRSLCKSTTAQGVDSFLVTDHRNHRIQRLDSSGRFKGEIGGCGLEKGKLVLPLSVAEFDDGALAVSMWHVNRRLVLLSSEGEELGHAVIDYSPGEILVDQGLLFVLDFEGNAIRVYERNAGAA